MELSKFFVSRLQIILNDVRALFPEDRFNREKFLRKLFENGTFIPIETIDNKSAWGIGHTRYFDSDKNWIFGFIYRATTPQNVKLLPQEANSLKEIKVLSDNFLRLTPFFFNFKKQIILTKAHGQIFRVSNSASHKWEDIFKFELRTYSEIKNITVHPIIDTRKFYEKINQLKIIKTAEFNLFGPNVLNDEKIRNLISEFIPTGTEGLIIVLKNLLKGLVLDSPEFKALLDYILKGAGFASFNGPDKETNKSITIKSIEEPKIILSTQPLDENSNENEINKTFKEINSELSDELL